MSLHDTEVRDGLVVPNRPAPPPDEKGVVLDAINAIRFLAVDAVEKANSGHPGTPMALAPLAYRLYTRHLRHDPAAPDWPDRDRFVLSIGHACMLQYAALHLAGYDLSIDDLKQFRQWGSRTPGHPERGVTLGIEINTGPLGQGLPNGVGMAMAERMLAAKFNISDLTVVDHRTWVLCGDGDMMEGITSEAASFAGRMGLGLSRLAVFYDDNHITLEGAADVEFSENVGERFDAYGWHVTRVHHVNDLDAIDAAIAEAEAETERPTLIIVRSNIGYGSPVQDTAKAHGSPLGADNVAAARGTLGWGYPPFEIPDSVYEHWRGLVAERATARSEWDARFAHYKEAEPERAAELERRVAGRLPEGWRDAPRPSFETGSRLATRKSSGQVLNALAAAVPELVGGSADVSPSTDTQLVNETDINTGDWTGRNIHFGIREHAMGAICNGLAVHYFRPYCATFFSFVDYMREPVRLASLMGLPVVFVYTHDSIGLGEDGPTHQPVEQLAGLRAMPVLHTIRPADANESAQAWVEALARHDGPTVLVFSRQGLPVLDPAVVDVAAGATVAAPGDDAVIVSTGSEVEVALGARDLLAADGINARVVSMPSWELFRARSDAERAAVLPPGVPSVSVEAASPTGWHEWVDDVVGLSRFGASAPGPTVMKELGITPENVADHVRRQMGR